MSFLKRWFGRFILSIQFLTRIPISMEVSYQGADFAGAMVFFPWIGALIGGLMALCYLLGNWLGGAFLGAALALFIEFFVAGGLHIDGIADLWDALYSCKDRERMLEIMKDSRIGTHGTLGIFFSQLLRLAGIYAAAQAGLPVVYILIALPLWGRLGIVCSAAIGRYARPTGTGRHFIALTGARHLLAAAVFALPAVSALLGARGLIVSAVPVAVSAVFVWRMTERFDGITGDMLGATAELCEVASLLCALLVWKVIV